MDRACSSSNGVVIARVCYDGNAGHSPWTVCPGACAVPLPSWDGPCPGRAASRSDPGRFAIRICLEIVLAARGPQYALKPSALAMCRNRKLQLALSCSMRIAASPVRRWACALSLRVCVEAKVSIRFGSLNLSLGCVKTYPSSLDSRDRPENATGDTCAFWLLGRSP